jgi:hypothetical protein
LLKLFGYVPKFIDDRPNKPQVFQTVVDRPIPPYCSVTTSGKLLPDGFAVLGPPQVRQDRVPCVNLVSRTHLAGAIIGMGQPIQDVCALLVDVELASIVGALPVCNGQHGPEYGRAKLVFDTV